MEQNIPHTSRPVGRTFVIAITVLGIIALIEIGAMGVKVLPRYWQAQAPTTTERTYVPIMANAGTGSKAPVNKDAAEAERLFEASAALERKGDYEGALNLLEEAEGYAPNEPKIIAKMAMLLEGLDKKQLAARQWHRLIEMGSAAGEYRKEAGTRYMNLMESTQEDSGPTGVRDANGLQPGSSLGIVECKFMEDTPTQKNLRLAIKSGSGIKINPKDVQISISFYKKVDGEIIPEPEKNAYSEWTSLPIDWTDDDIELLLIHYQKPTEPGHEYYGYMVTIYHKNLLQDFSLDQERLRKMFPPKTNILE